MVIIIQSGRVLTLHCSLLLMEILVELPGWMSLVVVKHLEWLPMDVPLATTLPDMKLVICMDAITTEKFQEQTLFTQLPMDFLLIHQSTVDLEQF